MFFSVVLYIAQGWAFSKCLIKGISFKKMEFVKTVTNYFTDLGTFTPSLALLDE